MRVNVVLPRSLRVPAGGYLVLYRYAETMASMGHAPTVLHPWEHSRPPLSKLPSCASAVVGKFANRRSVVPWHSFTNGVDVRLVPWLNESLLPRTDVTLLSGWQTSERIHRQTPRTGPLVQLVQDYELWATAPPDERERIAIALSHEEVHKVAVSEVVAKMLRSFGARVAATVTNGLDTERFRVLTEPSDRGPVVGFPARPGVNRGLDDALVALKAVRDALPLVEVQSFGSAEPSVLPDWAGFVGYVEDALLPEFYNRCSVFVLPSRFEGWGLPAAEAMACGAAVVTTANGGSEDFAHDGTTALVVPPGDPPALANAVVRLITDTELRIAIAKAGAQLAGSMSWERSTKALLNVLVDVAGRAT